MKGYYVACCVFWIFALGGLSFSEYLKSQEKQKELEIKKLELQLKLKEK